MPTMLTVLAFGLMLALFIFVMTNELRAFYLKARGAHAAARIRLKRPNS